MAHTSAGLSSLKSENVIGSSLIMQLDQFSDPDYKSILSSDKTVLAETRLPDKTERPLLSV